MDAAEILKGLYCEEHQKPLTLSIIPGAPPYCADCVDEAKRRQEKNEAEQRRADREARERLKWEARYKDLAIGARFLGKTFENYIPENPKAAQIKDLCERYAKSFPDRRRCGDSILMMGKKGTGKNHLAASISKAVIDQKFTAVHTTATKLVRAVKATWGGKGDEAEVLKSFLVPDLLVVDEVGAGLNSAVDQSFIFETTNERYAELKPTIWLTNCDLKQLEDIYGAPTVDRFNEGKSRIIHFDWESHRRPE